MYDDQRTLWGRTLVAGAGTQTTPLTARAYDQDQPEFCLRVPAGTGIWLYRLEVQFEAYAGTDNEIIVWTTTNDVGSGTSTVADETPSATNGLSTIAGNCTARQLYTANLTLTNYREVWRGGNPHADLAPANHRFPAAGDPWVYVAGAGTLGVQIAGTSTQPTFYLKAYWVEVNAQS
jgi:hypothetical protein